MSHRHQPKSTISRVMRSAAAGTLAVVCWASAQAQTTVTVPADTIDRLNYVRDKLMDMYTATRKKSTLEEALNGSLSFSVCFPTDAGAVAKAGAGISTKLVAAAGAGAHALGNGVAGWLKTQGRFSPFGVEFSSRTNVSTFPCLKINELHALHSGAPLFAIDMDILPPWADPADPPQRSYDDSGFPAGTGSRVGTLAGQDSGGVTAAEVINSIVDLQVKAGMDPSNLADVGRVLMGVGAAVDAKDALLTGSSSALDYLDSAAGTLTAMVDDSIIGQLMDPLLDNAVAVGSIPDPCNLNPVIGTFCDGALGLVSTVQNALSAVESFAEPLVHLEDNTPGGGVFITDSTVAGAVTLIRTQVGILGNQLDYLADIDVNGILGAINDKVGVLNTVVADVVGKADDLNAVAQQVDDAVCRNFEFGASYQGVSADVTFRPCSTSPVSWSWDGNLF